MTEQEWLECNDPTPMLEFLRGKTSERKLRLFAVACCRSSWNAFSYDKDLHHAAVCLKVIDIAERSADGLSEDSERLAAEKTAFPLYEIIEDKEFNGLVPFDDVMRLIDRHYTIEKANRCSVNVACSARFSGDEYAFDGIELELLAEHSAILREVFGNPFRPSFIDPRWLTSTVVDVAGAIYSERAFGQMPILADALMDAGCYNEEIIAHCRSEGPHVRGCWVVDLLLGKS